MSAFNDKAVIDLINAATETLQQQRREFVRGEIPDLDRLEDALEAIRVPLSAESMRRFVDISAELLRSTEPKP